jgi:hypothetical protein
MADSAAVCRVCHCEAEEGRPLFHPCNCSGSIKYIHQDCLVEWFKISNKDKCELCGEKITFRRIYAKDAPSYIGIVDLIKVLLPGIQSIICFYSDWTIRIILWLLVLPLITAMLIYSAIYYVMYGKMLVYPISIIHEVPLHYIVGFWWFGLLVLVFILLQSILLLYCAVFVVEVSTPSLLQSFSHILSKHSLYCLVAGEAVGCRL